MLHRGPAARLTAWSTLAIAALAFALHARADEGRHGTIVDLNGRPVGHGLVSIDMGAAPGADFVTVFADGDGNFLLPPDVDAGERLGDRISVRAMGYAQSRVVEAPDRLTVIMRAAANQAAAAPASAWLIAIEDRSEKARFVRNCVGCHQVPSPAVRAYAAQIDEVGGANAAAARAESWLSIVRYMNYLWLWEVGRANPDAPPDPHSAYSVGPGEEIAATMSTHFAGRMDRIEGYAYGAPVIATPDTVIREYEVDGPNAIREAVLTGDPKRLWVADVATNRMFVIDPDTGAQEVHEVPFDGASGPHTLHRAPDGSLWIAPFFFSVVARVDPVEKSWQTWESATSDGTPVGIHDLSFGADHELMTDADGNIWYSDIVNNAVGYFNPETGRSEIYPAPEIEGRQEGRALLYGLVMTADRRHVWFSQLGIGSFGNFNVETREFETRVTLPLVDAGPRRLTITEEDIMYVPLYGSGQLVEYDTRERRELGTYDLPDTGSAPYAVTWDPVRKVVWIATSNADVIYRFEPATKSFGVLPMPRDGALLRMIDIDPETGVLVTSYANILEFVPGPRMALIIDPGDGAYDGGLARPAE